MVGSVSLDGGRTVKRRSDSACLNFKVPVLGSKEAYTNVREFGVYWY